MNLQFRGSALEVGELETDAADEEVGEREGSDQGVDLDGVLEREGAKDEVAVVEVDVAQEQGPTGADGVEVGLGGAEGRQRDVVAIEDDEGAALKERGHGSRLLGVDADGDEALPVGAQGDGARMAAIEAAGGEVKRFDDGGRSYPGLGEGGCGGDDGNPLDGVGGGGRGGEIDRQELIDGELLCLKHPIEAFERQGAAAIEEVRDVSLAKAGLLSESGAGESTCLDAANEFQTEQFVKIGKVHNGRYLCWVNHTTVNGEDKANS